MVAQASLPVVLGVFFHLTGRTPVPPIQIKTVPFFTIYCGVTMIPLQSGPLPLIPLSMNRGIVEQHPERESFVVERFSADWRAWGNGTTTALKRSTTTLPPQGSWSQFGPKTRRGVP